MMLKCNLAVLFAERNIKISKASADTGISRTTLTSLVNNYSQGVQLDTLNKLCLYLQITPEKFFSYLPFDYKISGDRQSDELFIINFAFTSKGKTVRAPMLALVDADIETVLLDDDLGVTGKIVNSLSVELTFDEEASPEENEILKKHLSRIPAVFKTDIEDRILDGIFHSINEVGDVETSFSFVWPDELV